MTTPQTSTETTPVNTPQTTPQTTPVSTPQGSDTPLNKPQQISIFDAIKHYMKQNPLKIIIGTPCYGGLLHNGYFQSVMQLTANFTKLYMFYFNLF